MYIVKSSQDFLFSLLGFRIIQSWFQFAEVSLYIKWKMAEKLHRKASVQRISGKFLHAFSEQINGHQK